MMYLLSQLMCLFLKFNYVPLYMQYMFSAMMFITHGNWAEVIKLYFVTLANDRI